MAPTLHVCFLWHMHQPSYSDPTSGEVVMPWVRLHGVKDYTDMAAATAAATDARVTFNFVPGLWDQLDAVAAPDYGARERFWRLSRKPAEALDAHEVGFVRQHFFSLHHPTMLEPWPRYRELRDRVRHEEPLTTQELRDLQVCFDLAWCGETVRAEPDVAALVERGRDFTEDDKRALADAMARAAAGVADRYRALVAQGRVELTATPYYHPILPLLIDSDLARAADPGSPLPATRYRHPEDAVAHVTRAVRAHTERFGAPPAGMWPAEGSVAEPVVRIFSDAGVRWVATDEAILARSLGRDPSPAERHRPWRRGRLAMFFRDHALSDRIGFVYSAWPTARAHADFVAHLVAIRSALGDHDGVVTIALDGENCWEHYPGGCMGFLPGLYDAIGATDGLRLSTFSEALDAVAPSELPHLGAGSWIDGTFRTWLGDPVKNRAWELLAAARDVVGRDLAAVERDDPGLADLVMRAEASDWWWWFGQGHSSPFDPEFDALFRAHLAAIYQRVDRPVPAALRQPVSALRGDPGAPDDADGHGRRPSRQLSPEIDGSRDWFYKWLGAGEVAAVFGAIHRADADVRRLLYSNDDTSLYLRVDISQRAREGLEGRRLALEVEAAADGPVVALWPTADESVEAACEDVFEARVPLGIVGADLGVSRDRRAIHARLALRDADGALIERFPASGWAALTLLTRAQSAANRCV